MNQHERIDYLVKRLAGNNAKTFADKCGIDPKAISNMRSGKQGVGHYALRITTGYPDVSIDWLLTGEGTPLKTDKEKTELLEKMERLEKEVARLRKAVDNLSSKISSKI